MFKTFPEFSKLTLDDKEEYEALIEGFPPMSVYSFIDLMTWWNSLGYGSVSMLNSNLVIPYWLPGDDKTSGLSLIGTNKIDESICAIFDHLRDKGEKPRLVNVPEFVISSVQYPDMFTFKQHRDYDEYLLKVSDFYPIENMPSIWRFKINRKLPSIGEQKVEMRSLDLSKAENRDLLLQALTSWQARNINNYGMVEQEAISLSIVSAQRLGLRNICIFVDTELYGFCMYTLESDKKHATIYCIKATHSKSLGYELVIYYLAKWASEQGIEVANVNADCGLLRLRMLMLTFGPMNFYRKYTVEPREGK
jgi:hypothetical protein